MSGPMDIRSVIGCMILNTEDGSRILAKYYGPPHKSGQEDSRDDNPGRTKRRAKYQDLKVQKALEKGILEKTAKQTSDIIMYDDLVVLYKSESDVMIYVVGGSEENEIMLYNAILAVRDSLHLLFKQSVDKRTIIENYDQVSLAIDEIIDDGIILEVDPTIIVQRVSKAPSQDVAQLKGIDLSEQGINNLAQYGKSKIGDWLRQGL